MSALRRNHFVNLGKAISFVEEEDQHWRFKGDSFSRSAVDIYVTLFVGPAIGDNRPFAVRRLAKEGLDVALRHTDFDFAGHSVQVEGRSGLAMAAYKDNHCSDR